MPIQQTLERAPSQNYDELSVITQHERVLTEVDHLIANRNPDGSYDDHFLEDMQVNLKTAVMEAAMPYAVSRPEHDYEIDTSTGEQTFRWLGQTAVQAAMSGYKFHRHESARDRVAVEVREAEYAEKTLRPGKVQVFISPKMSETDAPKAIAKSEHLADDDALRIRWLETNGRGEVVKHKMESILVRDVPLSAWVDMLADPNNIFGQQIVVENPMSALSVMEEFEKLELDSGALPNGVLTILEQVTGYIQSPVDRKKVETHLRLFKADQDQMEAHADAIASRWFKFEDQLAESFTGSDKNPAGWATPEIQTFIESMRDYWSDENLKIIENHNFDGKYLMTRTLASALEKAKVNTLWATAGVLVDNQQVTSQLKSETVEAIKQNHAAQSYNPNLAEHSNMQNAQLIASQNVSVGGGCPGDNRGNFRVGRDTEALLEATKEELSWHGGKIKKGTCINCDEENVDVGVESWCQDCISC